MIDVRNTLVSPMTMIFYLSENSTQPTNLYMPVFSLFDYFNFNRQQHLCYALHIEVSRENPLIFNWVKNIFNYLRLARNITNHNTIQYTPYNIKHKCTRNCKSSVCCCMLLWHILNYIRVVECFSDHVCLIVSYIVVNQWLLRHKWLN